MNERKFGVLAWKEVLLFTWRYFSIWPLLKTFLLPFHRETSSPQDQMSLGERIVWSVLTRIIGFVFRIVIITFGLVATLISLILLPVFVFIPIPVSPHWLRRRGALGRDLAFGFTANLRRLSRDMSRVKEVSLIGKKEALKEVERILAREYQNNVLLVGDPGVGRTALVEQFAKKVSWGETFPSLQYRHIFELHTGDLDSTELRKLFTEASRAGNIIVVLDNLHSNKTLLDELLPFTQMKDLQIIGITDYNGYHTVLKRRPDIMQRFEKVEMSEPSAESVVALLKAVAESKGIKIEEKALKEIVNLTNQNIHNIPQPEKSLDILEELLVGEKDEITNEEVRAIISEKTGVPVGEISEQERNTLLNLEPLLKKYIVGQDEAVKKVSSTLQRARAGISQGDKPIGSFLFLGPTGVGKTYTAKILSRIYYGNDKSMIRFDMSEYSKSGSVDRFADELVVAIENNPFTLVLFDEIEKAHPAVLNLFLQILDEAHITDSRGEKAYFNNAFIICTSNASSILLAENPEITQEQLVESIIHEGVFTPEFLNRFDGVVAFAPIKGEDARQIAEHIMKEFVDDIRREKEISITYDGTMIDTLVKKAALSRFGARAIRHTIQDSVLTYLAQKILEEKIQSGGAVYIPSSVVG